MKWLAMRRTSGVTHLLEWDKDDPRGAVELRLEDLNHRESVGAYLQHTTLGPGRSIAHSFGDFDNVEISDLMRYGHRFLMLEGWIRGDQSGGSVYIGVVPCELHHGNAIPKSKQDLDSTRDLKRCRISNPLDCCVSCCDENYLPEKFPIAKVNPEDGGPFRSVSFGRKDPILHLAPLVPGVLSTRKGFPDLRWPTHRGDAMERRSARVRLRSSHRLASRAKGARR